MVTAGENQEAWRPEAGVDIYNLDGPMLHKYFELLFPKVSRKEGGTFSSPHSGVSADPFTPPSHLRHISLKLR